MTYRMFEHTADLGIEADGADLGEALSEAAMALGEVVTGRPVPRQSETEMSFQLEAPDAPAMVVAFLSELLWLLERDELLWAGGGVTLDESADGGLRLTAAGNAIKYEPSRHGTGVEVKAITYHELSAGHQTNGTYRVRVLLDI